MAYRAFPCFEARLWSRENSIGPRTFCGAKSRVYDRFGNRESMEYVVPITGGQRSVTYEYDKNNRLVEESRTGYLWTSEIAPESVTSYIYYEYDSMGNLVSKRGAESDLDSGEDHVGLNVLKTSPNNTLVEMYDYDGFNRLSKVRKGGITAQYTYNAEGIRTAKTVNGERTTFILDGGNVIGEVNPQNQVTNYIRGVSGIILSRDQSNTTKYYVTNGHGDVMGLTDTTGTVIKSYTYDAFGIEQNIDSNDTNPFRYCGEYFDSETQSIYLRARYYSPAIGRFTQQDPAMDGINWYVYCTNDPINYIDPSGLDSYVYYDPNAHDMGYMQRNAEAIRRMLEEKYGTPCHLVIVNSAQQFKENWNAMGTQPWQSSTIDEVVIYTHGKPEALYFGGTAVTSNPDYKGDNDVTLDELEYKEMKALTLGACNTAHLNIPNNIAYSFFNKGGIGEVYGFDGATAYDIDQQDFVLAEEPWAGVDEFYQWAPGYDPSSLDAYRNQRKRQGKIRISNKNGSLSIDVVN